MTAARASRRWKAKATKKLARWKTDYKRIGKAMDRRTRRSSRKLRAALALLRAKFPPRA